MEGTQVFFKSFLGKSPDWYKLCILGFLTINPVLYFCVSPFVAGWVLVAEFIFTLSMALKCYPLQPGGLLAIEAVIIGMTSPHHIKQEVLTSNVYGCRYLFYEAASIARFHEIADCHSL